MNSLLRFAFVLIAFAGPATAAPFVLAPAVAVEAEDFTIENGWRVIRNGQGNYMVDIIGFQHISGERLLGTESNATASAFADIAVPQSGDYRLWVRYEYPPFSDARFTVAVQQGGKEIVSVPMGARDNPRYAFGETTARPQYDPAWGPEGLVEEVVTVRGLQAGPAQVFLRALGQPQVPGRAANRNIDLVYLTADTEDAWVAEMRKRANLYPILEAFRETRGPRYEVKFTNRGEKPATFTVNHTYNRIPWYVNEGQVAKAVAPGAASEWIPLRLQDTAHNYLITFGGGGEPFDIEVRATGGAVLRSEKGAANYAFFFPPYTKYGEPVTTQVECLDAALAHLKSVPAIGKKPVQPFCYGGWMPLGQTDAVGRKYAELYAALGFRSLHGANSGPAVLENLAAVGIPPTRSGMVSGYRNPPIAANIEKAKKELEKSGGGPQLAWFDYGDEIGFSEWMGMMIAETIAQAKAAGQTLTKEQVVAAKWNEWMSKQRPGFNPRDYWLAKWGDFDPAKLKPDSSAECAAANPRLYVDSVIFYEDTAIAFAAAGAKQVKQTFGEDVGCGANYSCHPFYYPTTTMYVKWFREGAADMGRHSEYFWQVAQPGPMINGYITEHFRAGLRFNPHGVIRQYTMPHSPGNTDANFLRSVFSHLAHGAKMLDFFGIGMNDTFTENNIDHRDLARYAALRDVTHAVGFIEDLLPAAHAVPTGVGLLVSESTERWDMAGIATDQAGHAHFGKDFRKTRLNSHIERLGLYTALTFAGSSPDVLIEPDLNAKLLRDYKLLFIVGDSLPASAAAEVEAWVKAGGTLFASAGTGRFTPYREANPAWTALLGIASRQTDERETFFRPRQELPFLQPFGQINGGGWQMPVLATHERVQAVKDVETLATFADGSPAVLTRKLGEGRVFYCAALPGTAYLWTALQPPTVPDRGPGTHTIPEKFDPGAAALIASVLKSANIAPLVHAEPSLVDARLLASGKSFLLPIANYHQTVGQSVKLTLRTDAKPGRVTSAVHGSLPMTFENGSVTVTLPKLGYGDVLRLDQP
jgi:hypothetical protein